MLRVVQFLVSSSSSPLHKKLKQQPLPLGLGGLSLLHWNTNTNSSPSSSSLSRLHSLPSPFMSSPSPGTNRFRSFRLSATPSEESNRRDDAPPNQPLSHIGKASFCQWCGAATKQAIPDDDDKIRAICTVCGKVAYQNPKMVVGCLVEHDNKVLLCRRKIPPSYGLWTLPAGYMEIGESAVDGATRETQEEAGAEVEVLSPFAQIDIPLIGQTYIMFRAKLKSPHFSPGPESLECQLFSLDDIPFDSLAFSSMSVTLNLYIEDLKAGKLKFHYCTISKRPGSGPSDINAFTLDNHWQC